MSAVNCAFRQDSYAKSVTAGFIVHFCSFPLLTVSLSPVFVLLLQKLGHTFLTLVREGRRIKKAVWGVNRFPSYFIIMIALTFYSLCFNTHTRNRVPPLLNFNPLPLTGLTHTDCLHFCFTFWVRFYFRRKCVIRFLPASLNKIAQLYVCSPVCCLLCGIFTYIWIREELRLILWLFFWSDRW